MSLATISTKLTEDHFHEIIRKKGGTKYTSWEFDGAAGKKGDGYLSEVFKVILKGVRDNNEEIVVHLIIKTTPKSIGRRKTFRSADFFRNEINFYNNVLKSFEEFQSAKKDAKYPFKEIATCLLSYMDGENDFLVLENLNMHGYHTTSRQISMNIHLCRLIMQTLGRFHAISFVIRDQSPKLFEEISSVLEETYYAHRLRPWYEDFIKIQIEIAMDAVKKVYGEDSIVTQRAKKFLTEGSLYEKMVKLTHTRTRFSVVTHGDCWTPNFLIHSTKFEGRDVPVETKMIDFQLARFASPVLDLSFYIYSCTTEDLRGTHFNELIKAYHESLAAYIRDFGSNPDFLFPFNELENEMKKFFRFGVGMSIESIPFSLLEDEETADFDLIKGDDAVPITDIWILKKLTKPEELCRLAGIFKHASDMGFLD